MLIFISLQCRAGGESHPVAEFTLQDMDGDNVSLSDFRGQWVVLNYWATWCEPCREEMPELSQLHDQNKNITVLGLAFEDNYDTAFESFVRLLDVSYPILKMDIDHPPKPFGKPSVLPSTVLIDPRGRPIKTFFGPITMGQLKHYIEAGIKK